MKYEVKIDYKKGIYIMKPVVQSPLKIYIESQKNHKVFVKI